MSFFCNLLNLFGYMCFRLSRVDLRGSTWRSVISHGQFLLEPSTAYLEGVRPPSNTIDTLHMASLSSQTGKSGNELWAGRKWHADTMLVVSLNKSHGRFSWCSMSEPVGYESDELWQQSYFCHFRFGNRRTLEGGIHYFRGFLLLADTDILSLPELMMTYDEKVMTFRGNFK